MENSDKFLSIVILLFTIFGLLFLIYKNPSFCKKKEGFEIDCSACPSCEDLESRKYDLCEQTWMYGIHEGKSDQQLAADAENILKCYDTSCYEECYNGPEAGEIRWDPSNEDKDRDYNNKKYYESVCGQRQDEDEEDEEDEDDGEEDDEDDVTNEPTLKKEEKGEFIEIKPIIEIKPVVDNDDVDDVDDIEDVEESDCSEHIEKNKNLFEEKDICLNKYKELRTEYYSKIDEYKELNNKYKDLDNKYKEQQDICDNKYKQGIFELNNEYDSKIDEYEEKNIKCYSEKELLNEDLNETKTECSIKHFMLEDEISQLKKTIRNMHNDNNRIDYDPHKPYINYRFGEK